MKSVFKENFQNLDGKKCESSSKDKDPQNLIQ